MGLTYEDLRSYTVRLLDAHNQAVSRGDHLAEQLAKMTQDRDKLIKELDLKIADYTTLQNMYSVQINDLMNERTTVKKLELDKETLQCEI